MALPHGDNRLLLELEAVLRRVPTGAPGRDLPADFGNGNFGNGNSQFRRFRRRADSGVFQRLFQPSAAIPIWRMGPLTGRLSRFTRKPLGQRGHSAPIHWPLPRRADDEDRGTGGRPGQSRSLPPATRTEPREQRGSTTISHLPFASPLDDKAFDSDGLPREFQGRGDTAGIPLAQVQPQRAAGLRQGGLQVAPSGP